MQKKFLSAQQSRILLMLLDGDSSDEIAAKTQQNLHAVRCEVRQLMQIVGRGTPHDPLPMPAGR